MLAKIIFCSAVSLATMAVLLLALLSPVPYKDHESDLQKPLVALSLYIQQPTTLNRNMHRDVEPSTGVLTFHRMLTEGPESTSPIVGKAQGFIIPVEHFAHSAFNVIYLTFSTPEYSGSLSIQAKQLEHKKREELKVVGGTGSFAFARGIAVFTEADQDTSGVDAPIYQVDLQLTFPSQSQSIQV
ncbi:dirigent protein 8-like [Chenopodium quinoa]|uniref:dirigent protein 8-like n=1 Tax=Chenopodium quinoa TaxID=63459 RepID=UPI000B786659|nr:dirigent protein 8-like [Chenopodium quinoa]